MQCPKCNDTQLAVKRAKGGKLELDQCPRCQGIWFDKGELDVALGAKSAKHFEVPKIALQNNAICCPRCNEGMYEFCYPRTAVFIDMCKSCSGIWLDNKEWTEISTARNEKNKIICPKCKTKQDRSPECSACGVVFSKFHKPAASAANKESKQVKTQEQESEPESYADDIPGIKGTLLRFIDRSIASLTDY